jgi:hypothetical protein
MAIELSTFIIPKNLNTFFLIEDKFIKGGLHSCADYIERDALDSRNRKPGMVVVTQNDMRVWILETDKLTWTELTLGTGGGAGGLAFRATATYITSNLSPGASETFDLPMGKSFILYNLSVDKGPCKVQGFGTPIRDELNPYTFNALPTHLADDGITFLSDGTPVYGRRYSVLMNMEDIPTTRLYWTVTNTGSSSAIITTSFSFLPLE